jgi:hypothetical protein
MAGHGHQRAEVPASENIIVQAKDASALKLQKGVLAAIDSGRLSKAEVSTPRGIVSWTGSLAAGRCGRIGLKKLTSNQYGV